MEIFKAEVTKDGFDIKVKEDMDSYKPENRIALREQIIKELKKKNEHDREKLKWTYSI